MSLSVRFLAPVALRLMVVAGFALLAVGSSAPVLAQETGDSSEETPIAAFPDVLVEGTLPVPAQLFLRDKNGTLVFVPNVSLEEFRQFQAQLSGSSNADIGNFQFSSVSVEVKVTDDVAELVGDFRVALRAGAQRADIPLSFGTCQLGMQRPIISSDETLSQFMADSTGYRWILVPKSNAPESATEHSIQLAGLSKVFQESDRQNLRFSLPIHPCLIQVTLPADAMDERARSDDVIQREETEEGTRLTINSRGGDFVLSWRTREKVSRVSSVEAQSNTTFEIGDPRQIWRAQTDLNVRWYGSDASSQFRIRLPDGARWRAFPQPDFVRFGISSVVPESSDSDETAASELPVVLLIENFDPVQNPSIDIPLEWEWSPADDGATKSEVQAKVATPIIEEVSLHRGSVDCVFPASYAVSFTENENAKLIQQRRVADTFGSQRLQFAFTNQPFELAFLFRSQQSLPTVRPTYQVTVDQNKLVLTAWLDCSFDISQQRVELGMIFGDWILQDATAIALADHEQLFSSEGEELQVQRQDDGSYVISGSDPDPTNIATKRRVNQLWRLVAERSWTADENNQLEFRVPELIRDRTSSNPEPDHGSGALIVVGDDNMLLHWKDAVSTGLLSDSFSSEYEKFVGRSTVRKPLAYRFQSRGTTPTWAGSGEVLPQALNVSENVDLEVQETEVLISQQFSLQIANKPLANLQVAVRQDACATPPQFFADGQLVTNMLVGVQRREEDSSKPETTNSVDWNVYEINGAPQLLGNSIISVLTRLPWQAQEPAAEDDSEEAANVAPPTRIDVPLALVDFPQTARVQRRTMLITSDQEVVFADGSNDSSVAVQDEPYALDPSSRQLELLVSPVTSQSGRSPVRIQRSWLQTATTGDACRERFVALIEGQASQVEVQLTELAVVTNNQVQVLVDGKLRTDAFYRSTTDTWVINLPSDTSSDQHLIEIFYPVRLSLNSLSILQISPPRIVGAEHIGRFYWQLAAPNTQHLAWFPSQLAPEWHWRWGGLWWFRQSMRDESSLVALFGAQQLDPLPVSANQYLLSGREPQQTVRVWVVARHVIWFPVGICAIAISVLVTSVPFFRRPVCGFILAATIATFAMILPDLGILFGQTAVISLGLVALVFTIQAAVDSRVRRRSVFTTRPATYVDGSGNFSVARSVHVTSGSHKDSSVAHDGGV